MENSEMKKDRKVVINLFAVNVWGVLLLFIAAAVFGFPFYFIWPEELSLGKIFHGWTPHLLCALMLVGIVVHELLHGITWAYYAKNGWKSISFGVKWEWLTPYCHCSEPLSKRAYLIGALIPLLVLGLIPAIISLFIGNMLLLIFGAVFISGAIGDIWVAWLLRKEDSESLFLDHPSEAGFYVLSKEGEECHTTHSDANETIRENTEMQKGRKVVINMLTANVWSFLLFFIAAAVFGIPFGFIWHEELSLGKIFHGWAPLLFCASMLVGFVAHELLHGITWAYYAKNGWKSISFGVKLEWLAAYCHCSEPLSKRAYLMGALMPLLVLGLIPSIISLFIGDVSLLIFGVVFISAAIGDIWLAWLLRKEDSGDLFLDLPSEAGFYVLSKEEVECHMTQSNTNETIRGNS